MCKNEDVESELDPTWVEELIDDIAKSIVREIAVQDISSQIDAANQAAHNAQTAADEAKSAVDAARNVVDEVDDIVKETLDGYATEDYVNKAIESVDISSQLESLA